MTSIFYKNSITDTDTDTDTDTYYDTFIKLHSFAATLNKKVLFFYFYF